ncbi:response regulator [Geothrix sp. 21YS21S-4]|uniref:response regulator n=1 Tax=Geothrix sp. 21YS21S-4 TaxID=3068889 RepID=UPI0027B9E93A|nr:response regulator [Geothrix sp. 21YS21S-4]
MGQRLLLVDSDRGFLKEQQVSLEAAFDLEVAPSPDGVVARLQRGGFAAVLICVEVADNKGYALCSAIRKDPLLEDLKIALISAKATEEEYRRHQSLRGRADLYLHKPITPSTLVAALTPLVPGRVLDPDNPLGELVDTELGDDWLDGLRGALEAPASAAPPIAVPPPVEAPRVAELEAQVAALQEELRGRDRRLRDLETDYQRHLGSVTLNLDEAGRREQETGILKTQLKEALEERAGLIAQAESLHQQVGEKAQRVIDLLKERDRLLHDTLDLESFRTKVQGLEAALVAKEEALASMDEALCARDESIAELDESLFAKQQVLESALEAQGHLNTTLEGLVAQQAALENVHQGALLEVTSYKEKVHLLQLETVGLEATMRGQARDLAELGARVQKADEDLEAGRADMQALERQLEEQQKELEAARGEALEAGSQIAELRQSLGDAAAQHDAERLELMNGLDRKEAELGRLTQALDEQARAQEAAEAEREALRTELAAARTRFGSLAALVQEAQDALGRGADLARD